MNAPIFVRTRHVYESYADLWRLVELSGFPTCYVDEIDAASANAYILPTLNGEVADGWPGARARIIHWNLEWCEYPPVPGITERWHMDVEAAWRQDIRYVPVGGDARLNDAPDAPAAEPAFDVAYLGYMTNRRQQLAGQLDWLGVSRSPTSVWGDERAAVLRRSRAYLHVHQHDLAQQQGVPALRMVVAAAYFLPVIMEQVEDRGIFGSTGFLQADYHYLPEFVRLHVRDRYATYRDFGFSLHNILCEQHPFRKVIEAAL